MSNIIKQLEDEQLRTDHPEFGPGDTVRVMVRVAEGGEERLQACVTVVCTLLLPCVKFLTVKA